LKTRFQSVKRKKKEDGNGLKELFAVSGKYETFI
jgi:hypothetical protein